MIEIHREKSIEKSYVYQTHQHSDSYKKIGYNNKI